MTFVCDLVPTATKVFLVGDFNNWDATQRRMYKAKDGSFRARMHLSPGKHWYKFVADGVWLDDADGEDQVLNSYGTVDSVVRAK